MLKIFRKKKVMKWLLGSFAVAIIITFVLWGTGDAIRSRIQGKSYVGKISGKKISFNNLVESQVGIKVQLLLSYFDQAATLDKFLRDRPLVNKLAWERLIILDDAAKRDIRVSDAEVISFITNHPLFTSGGQFDRRLYTYLLQNKLNMTERVFEEKLRENIKIIKLNNLFLKGVGVTDDEAKDLYKKEYEKARISYILIEKDKFKAGLQIPDAEALRFFNENREKFILPETINVEYIAFKYASPEEKEPVIEKLLNIFSKIQKTPAKIYETIKEEGVSFEETGYFAKGQIVPKVGWIPDFYSIAFGLQKGQIGEPVIPGEDKGTCFILWVKDIREGQKRSFEESKDAIAHLLKEEKALELAKENAQSTYEKAKSDNLTLEEIAKVNSLELKKTDFVSRFEYIEGIGESYTMVDEALKLGVGEISAPVPSRAGYVVLKPEEFLLIDEKKFEEEKENFKNKALSMKKTRILNDWFNDISKNAELVIDLDKL